MGIPLSSFRPCNRGGQNSFKDKNISRQFEISNQVTQRMQLSQLVREQSLHVLTWLLKKICIHAIGFLTYFTDLF